MTDVGLVAAFAAGVLALLSPCSALLLPSFFAYAFGSRVRLLARTAVFWLGLCLTLVPLGVGASAVSSLVYGHRQTLIAVAGWAIIAFGVLQILGRSFAMPFATRLQTATSGATAAQRSGGLGGWTATLLLGAVYGLAGFCSGPILGAILTMAATTTRAYAALLLAVYALGMAAPLFVLAAVWDRLGLGARSWVRGRELTIGPLRVHTTSLISGLLLIAIGVLFLRYQGTAGLAGGVLGRTEDLEMRAQEWLAGWGGLPLWVWPAAFALIALGVAVSRMRRG
ncbi:MAG: cytochrome c biogenesis protein CcdA [Micrococcales bacterium]|nr:cytochrome c biogenesis protein CcdA [Micrococcales bacterium]